MEGEMGEMKADYGPGSGLTRGGMEKAAMVQARLKSASKSMESFVKRAVDDATWPPSEKYSDEVLFPIATGLIAIFVVFLISRAFAGGGKKKLRAVDVQIAGPGIAKRNRRFLGFVETPWPGVTTVADILESSAAKHRSLPCFGMRQLIKKEMEVNEQSGKQFEKLTLGDYSFITYGEALDLVKALASGLTEIGHGRRERLAIFSETRQEWQLTLQACCRMSVTAVTVYASLGEEALVHALNETECTTVVCDPKQFEKVIKVGGRLSHVRRVVYMEQEDKVEMVNEGQRVREDWELYSFAKLKEIGQEHPTETQMPSPDDIAVIMYTSGSTGLPKGVMVTHSNLVSVATAAMYMIPDFTSKDVYLSFLPLAHIFALIAELTMILEGVSIGYGSPLTLSDSSSKIKKGTSGDLTALKPTLMIVVPTILDRIYDAVKKQVDKKGGFSKALFQFAYNRCLLGMNGKWWGAHGLEKYFWNALIFNRMRKSIGGRMRGMFSGGAPLAPETQRFMNIGFGIPIVQGYGLTETCAGSCFTDFDDLIPGRVGPPLSCCFIKLVDWEEGNYKTTDKPKPRGEVCIGGPSVTMGYFNNPEKTEEVYKVDEEGIRWFYSGDIGQWNDDGTLEIIDRKKDIVKLQMGEYVSLAKVEVALIKSDFIDNIMVHADPLRSYVVALVVPNLNRVKEWANVNAKEVDSSSDAALCDSELVTQQVLKSIQQVAKEEKLERFEVPTKIKLVVEPWMPENGMTTASMKLKREVIRQAYKAELDELYK